MKSYYFLSFSWWYKTVKNVKSSLFGFVDLVDLVEWRVSSYFTLFLLSHTKKPVMPPNRTGPGLSIYILILYNKMRSNYIVFFKTILLWSWFNMGETAVKIIITDWLTKKLPREVACLDSKLKRSLLIFSFEADGFNNTKYLINSKLQIFEAIYYKVKKSPT